MPAADDSSSGTSSAESRNVQLGEPGGHFADDLDAFTVQAQYRDYECCRDHRHQRSRQARYQPRRQPQQSEAACADGKRRPVGQAELADDLEEARHDPARLHRKAQQLADLAEHDAQRNAVHESDQDRPRQEIGQRTQLEEAAGYAEETGDEGQRQRQRGIDVGIAGCKRRHRRGHEGACRCIRADDELPRRAEQRIGHQRQDAGVQADLGTEAGELRVRHAYRQGDCRDRQAGDEIVRKIGGPIAQQ